MENYLERFLPSKAERFILTMTRCNFLIRLYVGA
jgi:hypothetical protein